MRNVELDRWWWIVKQDGEGCIWKVCRANTKTFDKADWRQRFSTRRERADFACSAMNRDRKAYLKRLKSKRPIRHERMISEKPSRHGR
jgi:hypothetical protein